MELAERVHRGRRAISLAGQRGLGTTAWECYLAELLVEAGREPSEDAGFEPWLLWEGRRVSIPEWRNILQECLSKGEKRRGEYAKWMLRYILLDPRYPSE